MPSKALLHIAKRVHDASGLAQFGINVTGQVDFRKVFEAVREVQAEIRSHETPEVLGEFGVKFAFGEARFVSRDSVQVGGKTYSARRIVIATGARPRITPVPGIEQVAYLTHENLWDLDELPAELLIVGAGPIGMEMSQAFTRLGSKVTVLEKASRLLLRDSKEAGELIGRHLGAEGVRFICNAELTRFPRPTPPRSQLPTASSSSVSTRS